MHTHTRADIEDVSAIGKMRLALRNIARKNQPTFDIVM